ncbi:hypothetical protein DITRI_Ditri01bG0201600 [Diplodiscus trichospermus]
MGQILSGISRFITKRLRLQDEKRLRLQDEEETEDPNKQCCLPISTRLLGPLNDTNSIFHQNAATTCIDIVEENNHESASVCVSRVDNLKGTEIPCPARWNKHCCLPISTPFLEPFNDTNSIFEVHQNVSTTCIDIVEENSQESASVCVSGVDNLAGSEIRCPESWNNHSYLPISTPLLEPFNDTNSIFEVHQDVTITCIDIVEENSQKSASVCVSGVANLEGTEIPCPERWIRHYCSSHKMLLVGEGDFSFSASLAVAFGSAANMVATSLDSSGFLFRNYKKAMSNIHELKSRGCTVLHGVDATKMANYCFLGGIKFDRVIYNFPHAGFFPGEPSESHRRRNQLLLSLFFKNAKEMIHENGEIHVTHKCNGFFLSWNLRGLASAVGLELIQELPFNYTDYPGYRTKYGFGGDKNFNSNPSKTYKFGLLLAASP